MGLILHNPEGKSKEGEELAGTWEDAVDPTVTLVLGEDDGFELEIANDNSFFAKRLVWGKFQKRGDTLWLFAGHWSDQDGLTLSENGALCLKVRKNRLVVESWQARKSSKRDVFHDTIFTTDSGIVNPNPPDPPIELAPAKEPVSYRKLLASHLWKHDQLLAERSAKAAVVYTRQFFDRVLSSITVTYKTTESGFFAILEDEFGRERELHYRFAHALNSREAVALVAQVQAHGLEASGSGTKNRPPSHLELPALPGGLALDKDVNAQVALVGKLVEWVEAAQSADIDQIERELSTFRQNVKDGWEDRYFLQAGVDGVAFRLKWKRQKNLQSGVRTGRFSDADLGQPRELVGGRPLSELTENVEFSELPFWYYTLLHKEEFLVQATRAFEIRVAEVQATQHAQKMALKLEEETKALQEKEAKDKREEKLKALFVE